MNQPNILFKEQQAVGKLVPQPQYSCYAELISTGVQNIDTSIFTDMNTLDNHFHQVLAMMLDGIETPQIQNAVVYVHFVDREVQKLSLIDYWFNLLFWGLPVATNHPIDSRYLCFYDDMTQGSIADYINNNFLKINRKDYINMDINNMIDNIMYKFQFIDKFSLYLYNTANNEDTIDLMKKDKTFYDCIHCDLSKVPIEDVKDVGMKYTKLGVQSIINSKDHWAVPYFKAKEGINIKQFREFMFNIGTVPNDDGGVYPRPINGNFSNRGITDVVDYLIEAAKARKAQILSHQNVGLSGAFARILGLNNMDDRLYPDPNYVCDSKHFVAVTIKDAKTLSMYKNRYYRFTENGVEYRLSPEPLKDSTELIGKTILVRSPITCASRARGHGVCHRCYGDLAKTNYDINIGKIAAEILSSLLTQRLLSAKHLLESNVKKLSWCPAFPLFFDINFSSIRLKEDAEFKKYKFVIHQDAISSDNDEDDTDTDTVFNFNNYVTEFTIVDPKGVEYFINTTDEDNMYFSVELDKMIKRKKTDGDGYYVFSLEDLRDKNLFFIEVVNNELSRTLDRIKNVLNKKAEIKKLVTKEAVTQELIDTIIEGGLTIDAIHLETILSHQCVSAESILLEPEWQYINAEYRMVTLNERLRDNPSVTVSLMYKDINKLLFYPLTFIKSKASVLDLFYMTKPQNYMSMRPEVSNLVDDKEPDGNIKPFIVFDESAVIKKEDDSEG